MEQLYVEESQLVKIFADNHPMRIILTIVCILLASTIGSEEVFVETSIVGTKSGTCFLFQRTEFCFPSSTVLERPLCLT